MREIIFRGKRTYENEWIYGSYLEQTNWLGNKSYQIVDKDQNVSLGVNPSTVGQYTGLKDKNGKMIFEGDIIKPLESCSTWIILYHVGSFVTINTELYKLFMESKENSNERKNPLANVNSLSMEIIGNIHDNPELVNEK